MQVRETDNKQKMVWTDTVLVDNSLRWVLVKDMLAVLAWVADNEDLQVWEVQTDLVLHHKEATEVVVWEAEVEVDMDSSINLKEDNMAIQCKTTDLQVTVVEHQEAVVVPIHMVCNRDSHPCMVVEDKDMAAAWECNKCLQHMEACQVRCLITWILTAECHHQMHHHHR